MPSRSPVCDTVRKLPTLVSSNIPAVRGAALTLTLFIAGSAFAFESRQVDPNGNAVAGAQISVVNQSGTARTDASGQ